MRRLLVVDERVRTRASLLHDLRGAGFEVTSSLSASEELAAIVVAIDGLRDGVALPPCARSEPAWHVPVIVHVPESAEPELRLRAAIEGAARCVTGVPLVDVLSAAIGAVTAPQAPSVAEQRRLTRIDALETVARRASASEACPVRVTRLEHRPVRGEPAGRAEPEPPLCSSCTPRQRELLAVIAREGNVAQAALAIGTSRSSIYAALRRIAHREGLRDSAELLRRIGASDPWSAPPA